MATHDVNARRFFDREGPFSEQGRETERSANTLPAVPVALHWDDVARGAEAEERRAMPCCRYRLSRVVWLHMQPPCRFRSRTGYYP